MLSPRGAVFPDITNHLPPFLRSPRNIVALGFGVAIATGVTSYVLTRTKPSADEIERLRRDNLALNGRITDGSITETEWLTSPQPDSATTTGTPAVLIYRYVIAGVTYECAQDVTPLLEYVHHVRVDLPVQVRFDPRNPGNSIVVAEGWSGLRLELPDPDPAGEYKPDGIAASGQPRAPEPTGSAG
jgi:hypothetical protein